MLSSLFRFLALTFIFVSAATTQAGSYAVANLNDSGSGSLRAAIISANANPDADTITFAAGAGIIQLQSALPTLTTSITISGPGASSVSVYGPSGSSSARVFTVASNSSGAAISVTISGLTIANGNTNGGFGGGANISSSSGAVTCVVQDCAIKNNLAGGGGGVSTFNASVTLRRCTLSGNSTSGGSNSGGGLIASGGTVAVESCTFVSNTSSLGGGVSNSNSTLTLSNSTFSANTGSTRGAALYNDGTATVDSCTIAESAGVGIYNDGATLTVGNTLVSAGSSGANFFNSGSLLSNGYNLSSDATGPTAISDRRSVAPQLGTFGNHGGPTQTYELLSSSPARDTGSTSLATDQRGVSRPQGSAKDVGAYEVDPVSFVVNTLADEDDGSSNPMFGTGTSLREAMTVANSSASSATITFAAGLSGTIELNSPLPPIRNSVTITGPGANLLKLHLSIALNVFYIFSGLTVNLSGMTIADGQYVHQYGAPYFSDASAIANAGNLTITACTIRDIRSENGGAIYNSGGTLTVRRCLFANNEGRDGGAIWTSKPITIENSTFSANTATGSGGAIFVTNNSAISIDSVTMTLNKSNIYGDGGSGGGLSASNGGNPAIHGSIISGNIRAGGYVSDVVSTGGDFTNSIIGQYLYASSNNVTVIDDPKLGPLQDNGGPTSTHALLIGSPAINRSTTALTVDQRGVARPYRNAPDLGAYEFDMTNPSLVVTTTADEDDGNSDVTYGNGTSLREAINYANSNPDLSTITFDAAAFSTLKTIGLNGTPLPTLSTNVNIVAPSAGLIINGNGSSRVFQINGGASVTLTRLMIAQAYTTGNGGGIYIDSTGTNGGTIVLDRCTIYGNHAGYGGGVYYNNTLTGASLTLKNCTLYGNVAEGEGAGLYNGGGTAVLDSCTFTSNGTRGLVSLANSSTTKTELRNCIISANNGGDVTISGGNGSNSFVSDGYNLIGSGNALGAFNSPGDLKNIANPQLGSFGDNGGGVYTLLPASGSPVLDLGSTTLAIDQRGVARPQGAAADIGAVEAPAAPTGSISLSPASAFTNTLLTAVTTGITNADGGTLTLTYVWKKNGVVIPGQTGSTLDLSVTGNGDRGDVVRSEVTATNANSRSTTFGAQLTVQNSAPIVNAASFTFTQGQSVSGAQIAATDADGDALTFSISSGTLPAGLSPSAGGAITGKPSARTSSTGVNVTVAVSDGTTSATASITILVQETPSLTVNTLIDSTDGFDGLTSLREAITLANSNADVSAITISNTLTGTIELSGVLPDLTTDISITGPGASALTIHRNTRGNYRIFNIASGKVITLSGLTISNGNTSGNGGGISNAGNLTITACAITGNTATTASTSNGGGIYNIGTLLLQNSSITGNSTGNNGGGVYNRSTITVTGCTFSGNSATNSAGGLHNRGATAGYTATATVTNCTFSGNSAVRYGGGFVDEASNATTLQNCTITGNTGAADQGGGFTLFQYNSALITQVSNCIIASNTGGDAQIISGDAQSNGYNLIGTTNLAGDFAANGDRLNVSDAQLALGPLQINAPGNTATRALLPGSIAINAGNTSLTTDQRGLARPQGFTGDIGAYELFNAAPVAGTDTLTHFAGQSASVLESTLLANDTDAEGDLPLTILSVSAAASGQATISRANGYVFYDPAPGFTGIDSFTYVVIDSFGSRGIGLVNVTLSTGTPRVASTTIVREPATGGGTQAHLTFNALLAGRSYRVQYTNSLTTPITWTAFPNSVIADANGQFQVIDPPPLPSQRFYRAVYP